MDISKKVVRDIQESLDELRDATVNRDYRKADKLKKMLLTFLKPLGYTLVDDKKEIYVLQKVDTGGRRSIPSIH